MSQTVVHSPIHEAELFLGKEAQNLQSNDELYQAYTQEYENPLSLYIGQDVATLLANPTVQGQITSKLHSTPHLVQIKITPQRELFVAKTGTTDFHRIDFEEDSTPPEVSAIAEKSMRLYLAMQPTLISSGKLEEMDSRPREWSHGYPTPVTGSDTTQLHERIHSLETQLATERLRGDMREMREDIRENRGLLLELLRSRGTGSPATDREIDTLRRQLERTTGQVDRLIDQARDRGLAHSAEMHDLLRENDHLRRVCTGSQEDLRELEVENDHLRRAYGKTRHELGALHEALVSDTTPEALANLRRLERTIDTLREREGVLQEALEVDLPEEMLAKVFEIRGSNVELRRQLHEAQGALEEYQDLEHQTTTEIRRLKHTVSDLNLQFRHDQQIIHNLIHEVKELKARGSGNEERIERLTGQLREFHDKLFPTDHDTAVATLDCIIGRMNTLSRLEGSLQDILEAEGPEDIIQKVLALRESHGELGVRLGDALQGVETLQRKLEESEHARGEFEQRAGELHEALQAEKKTTASLRHDLALEKQETERLGVALGSVEERNAELLLQKGEVENQLGQAKREVERLGALSRDLTEKLRVSEEDRGRLGREKDLVEEALREATQEKEDLGEQLGVVTKQLRDSKESELALKEEVSALEQRVVDLGRDNGTLLGERDRALEALEQSKTSHVETQRKLRQEKETSAALLEQQGKVKEEIVLATAQVKRLSEQLGVVTNQLRVSEEDRGRLGREKGLVETALREATARADRLDEQLVDVTEKLRVSEEAGVALKEEVATLGRRVEDLERENATLLQQRDGARKTLASLKLTHGKTQERLQQVESELLGARDLVLDAEERSEALRREFSTQKRDLERQVRDLTEEVRAGRVEIEALTQKLGSTEQSLERNQRELHRLDGALKEAQASAKHWEGEARKHDGNHREALAANRELQKQHGLREAGLLQEISLKGAAISQGQTELARVRETARSRGDELTSLKSEFAQHKREYDALRLEHSQVHEELRKAKGEIAHIDGIATDLEGRYAVLDKELSAKKDHLAGAEREIAHLNGIATDLERRYAALNEELSAKKDELAVAEREIDRVGGIVLKQEGQLEALGTELERSKKEFVALRSEHSLALEELRAEQEKGRGLQAKLDQVGFESLEQSVALKKLQGEHRELLSENQELSSTRDALQRKKEQLEEQLGSSGETNQRLLRDLSAVKKASKEQETALSAQREEIGDLSGQLTRIRQETESRNAAYEKQIAELSTRLTPHAAQQLREELATQKSAVARLTEELRGEREKATAALEEVDRRESPQETYESGQKIARLKKELEAASLRSGELGEELSVLSAQSLKSQSQHGSEVLLLRQKLKDLQASLHAAERQVEERLAPEAERGLRAQLKAQSETSSKLTTSLKEATRERARAEGEVKKLSEAIESRGSLSEQEIEALQKQLREAEGAALRATQNAAKSEERFQVADEHRLQLQDEVLLLRKLNKQLQTGAEDAVALKKVLAEIANAVGSSERPSALPGIVREKIAELRENQKLLEILSDQIIDPLSLARQLDQVEFSMLPQALKDRLGEVEQLHEEHEETLAEASRKDEEIFSLKQALDEARSSLSGFAKTQEALRERESELEVLTGSAERMELSYKQQVAALKKEVGTLKASVEERQSVVEEFYDKMVSAEEQRDAAIEQRDTAQLAVQRKTEGIATLELRIGSMEKESMELESEVFERGKTIKRLEAALGDAESSIGEYREQEDESIAEIVELRTINRRQAGLLKENEKELAELRSTVDALRSENGRLKNALERIAAVLRVPFTIDDPEQLAASLEGRASELKQERAQLQDAYDTHMKFLGVAQSTIEGQREEIEDLTQTALAQREAFESQVKALEQDVRSLNAHLKEARAQVARYDEELSSAHSLNETISESAAKDRALTEHQQKNLVGEIRAMEHALHDRELRYEELTGDFHAAREETARLHERIELTQAQRDIQQAVHAGDVMEVLGAALGKGAFSLGLRKGDKALLEVSKNHQEFLTIASNLDKMRAEAEEVAKEKGVSLPAAFELIRERYYGRHAAHVSGMIAKINSAPGTLSNLSLFIDFFKVTSEVSSITRTREFVRLAAARRILDRLHPERDAERIVGLKVHTTDLTRGLLRNLMESIHESTKAGSGVSRYSNFGLRLLMWEDILNNLDDSQYIGGDRTQRLKAKDAESLRRTVHQLNVQFHHLMASTHHQVKPGVWVPNK